ncbi:MAG TPA: zinc-dependent alcohol dehydrogenase family protein [Caldimonas sp.]|nr:zinc-dependent alcohol dehydrogenase family protein [Caldimonas sp.]
MRAMVLNAYRRPLLAQERPTPDPGPGEVLIRVRACAVCRTDLHVVDGELPHATLPIVPGHEIVGTIERIGPLVDDWYAGDPVGVPWLAHTCGSCDYCRARRENLCDAPKFTGYTRDGGFATHVLAEAAFCVRLGALADDPVHSAPLLCAGLIGWRALQMAGDDVRDIGLYGFGAAAHVIAQVAIHEGRRVHAFTRPGDTEAQSFARDLGVAWAGGSDERPPRALDAAILFAPVGALVPQALSAVRKGGRVVCGGIHMSDIPSFPYRLLWEERELRSVANLTRADASTFMAVAARVPLHTTVRPYPLEAANEALDDLRHGRLQGAAVLVP